MKCTFIWCVFDILDVDICFLYYWSNFTKFDFDQKLYDFRVEEAGVALFLVLRKKGTV
jgi:hypothetical protein